MRCREITPTISLPRTTGKSSCRECTALSRASSSVSAGDRVEKSVSITSSSRTLSNTDWKITARSSSCAAEKIITPTMVKFVPGDEGYDQQESRASAVLLRVMALSDDEVRVALDDVVARFSAR